MIDVKKLTKRYGNLTAVDSLSFSAKEGEILGFLGPNGAGKSTTMNMITGYISITSGSAKIAGYDILEQPVEAKRRIGYLPEQPPLYPDMTVDEYLRFVSKLKQSKLGEGEHLDEICELVRIADVRKRLIGNLSKGYRQRVGFAQALVGNPPVLILDEPTAGLDPNQIVEIRSLIKRLGEHHTVLLSTHILSEAQAVCDRVLVINHGKLIADSSTQDLGQRIKGSRKLLCEIAGPESAVVRELQNIRGVRRVTVTSKLQGEREYAIDVAEGCDVRREIFEKCRDKGWILLGSKSSEPSLEDIFIALTN